VTVGSSLTPVIAAIWQREDGQFEWAVRWPGGGRIGQRASSYAEAALDVGEVLHRAEPPEWLPRRVPK
jgi:hypothetical protein